MRILALTADPSLEVALGMIDEWEVVAVSTVTAAANHPDAAVLLIGQPTSDEGISAAIAAGEHGLTMPMVIVGDEVREGAPATLVLRPFSLDDLQDAVERALAASTEVPNEPDPTPEDEPEGQAEDGASDDRADARADEPDPPQGLADDPASESGRDQREELEGVDLAEVRTLPQKPAPPPSPPPVERSTGSGALRLVKEPPQRVPVRQVEESPAETPATAAAAPVTTPAEDGPTAPSAPAPAPPTEAQRPAEAQRPVPPQRAPAPAARDKRRFGRRRARDPLPEPTDPLGGRLREAARAAHLISDVLRQLPMLRDVRGLAQALIGEIGERFTPKTAAIYVRRGGSFVPIAGFALSPAEMKLAVPETHALVGELEAEGEALLIAPVDLARGVVTGIAGARTEALLAAPIAIDGVCSAFLIVGRDDFADEDLDAIELLAREAAAGLTVASALDALGASTSGD